MYVYLKNILLYSNYILINQKITVKYFIEILNKTILNKHNKQKVYLTFYLTNIIN